MRTCSSASQQLTAAERSIFPPTSRNHSLLVSQIYKKPEGLDAKTTYPENLHFSKMSSTAQDKGQKYNFPLHANETPGFCETTSGIESDDVFKQPGPPKVPKIHSSTATDKAFSVVPQTSSTGSLVRQTPQFGQIGQRTPHAGSFTGSHTGGTRKSRTPGSISTPRSLTTPASVSSNYDHNASVVVALVEGRGLARGEVGMASLDLRKPTLILSQFSDTQTYIRVMTKLQVLRPIEVVFPNTVCDTGSATKLFNLVSEQMVEANIATVQRKYFNENRGLQYVKQLSIPECSTVEMEISSKYYCLAATAALLKYIEYIQNVTFAANSLMVVFKGSEQTTMIDAMTAKNLELVQNLKNPKSEHSLFGVLNYTKTIGGARLFRSNLLQPPCNLETITMRQNAVTEMTENEELFFDVQSVIGRFLDVDHLLAQCVQIPKHETIKTAEMKINTMIYLKHTLELVEPLHLALHRGQTALFKAYHKSLEDPRYTLILKKLTSVIQEDTRYQKGTLNMRMQKCFAVKPGINGLLDVARRTYTEIVDDIAGLVQQLGEMYKLNLRVGYNTNRGFHIQLYAGAKDPISSESLPPVFIKTTKFKNTLSFTTTDMIKYNDRLKESLQEIYLMTSIVVSELMKDIVEQIGCLYQLAECVSMVDMLQSLAHTAMLADSVRPEFTDTLACKKARHPILEKISIEPPIPNNIFASPEHNFCVITGPNMSGKSTYLRQVALLQVQAQIGAFVPAEYASFRIADQIFSRIGSDDDMATNCSSFMLELREINYIAQNATGSSLIIIDELGRGTCPDEGAGLCFSICEYLLNLKAFTFFATHYLEVSDVDKLYPNVHNYHFEFNEETELVNNHVLVKGKARDEHYVKEAIAGIALAQISSLPVEIIRDAKEILKVIELKAAERSRDTPAEPTSSKVNQVTSSTTSYPRVTSNTASDSRDNTNIPSSAKGKSSSPQSSETRKSSQRMEVDQPES